MHQAPGTVRIDAASPRPVVRLTLWDRDTLEERVVDDLASLAAPISSQMVAWVHVDGLGDQATIEQLRDLFGIHRLAIEDVVNIHQRPKAEDYERHLYIVIQIPFHEDNCLRTEQLSIFLGPSWVLTFEERPPDIFDPIRDRLRKKTGLVRDEKADYLTYAILDCVLDCYFPLVEQCCDRLEALEQKVLKGDSQNRDMDELHLLKQELLAARRAVWPARDLVALLLRNDRGRFSPTALLHLRDAHDHTAQLVDMIEVYRELASDLVSLHLMNLSVRQNETMKVLTVISAIFIPLGFIAGIYGMNFDRDASPWSMPELGSPHGYPAVLLLMALVATAMLAFFRRKGWI